jgi:hypothetical protein
VRSEHACPGELLHLDTKRLARIERLGHRITGHRRRSVAGAGWEYLFVATDDHSRIAFTEFYPEECKQSAVEFLRHTVGYFATAWACASGAC